MSDIGLKDLIDKLTSNEKILGLVKMMQPLDVVAVIATDLSLHDKDAKSVVANLLAHLIHQEGMASPGIETNMQYPIPAKLRRDTNDNEDLEEDFVNNLGALTPDIKIYQFPTQGEPDPEDWPYDAITKAAMDTHNKANKKGLTSGKTTKGNIVFY